ncbi:MAG TPA: hypothetical protein VF077_08880 [Nitrospiraceae bacterium]
MVTGENPWKLQSLSDKHKQAAALLAQGCGPLEIGAVLEFTPQYITMLQRDPLFKKYLADMVEVSETRLDALFNRSVDIIAEGLDNGASENQLKAARLQLEVTGRIGKNMRNGATSEDTANRLARLAERLVKLLPTPLQREALAGGPQALAAETAASEPITLVGEFTKETSNAQVQQHQQRAA